MDNDNRAKLDTCARVEKFNTTYAKTLKDIDEYALEKDAFDKAHTLAKNAALAQTSTVGPSKEEVEATKQKMAKTTFKYAIRGKIKAAQLKKTTLSERLEHSITYIYAATKNVAVDRATDIRDTLSNNLTDLTNIKPENITEITTAIDDYVKVKDLPIITSQKKTATGTDPLAPALSDAMDAIDNMYGLVYSYLIDSNKTLVDEFALAKQIINTGLHHNGVTGTVYKNGKPVPNAVVKIVGTNKSAVTDAEGHYTISKVKAGKYTIEASDEGGNSDSKTVHITNGHVETIDFNLA